MSRKTLRSMTAAAAIAASLTLAAPAPAAAGERSPARASLDGARVWLGELLAYLGLNPGGLQSASGELGPYIDPDGAHLGPEMDPDGLGPYIDPNGGHGEIDPNGAPTTDLGPEMDPNG